MASSYPFSLLLALLLTMTLAACGGHGKHDKSEAEADAQVAVPVEVALAYRGDVSAFYSGTAALEAEHDAQVVAKVGGVVEKLFVEEGQPVKAGQVMAKLDDARLSLEVARAEANLAKLEQEYRRQKQLHASQLVSAEAYERLGHELNAMRADLELARLQLAHTEIRAPFDGLVAERHIKIGNMIQQNATAFRVTTFDPLIARLHVPERELNKLAAGQHAQVRVDALPNKTFSGTVDRISPVIDASTGTFAVTVAISGESNSLKPGMFGRVAIVHDTRTDAVLVPRASVVTEDAKANVFVVRDGMAQRQIVETGYITNGSIEIRDGIKAGDAVITVGQSSLKDGARVAVINEDVLPDAAPGDELPGKEQVAANNP